MTQHILTRMVRSELRQLPPWVTLLGLSSRVVPHVQNLSASTLSGAPEMPSVPLARLEPEESGCHGTAAMVGLATRPLPLFLWMEAQLLEFLLHPVYSPEGPPVPATGQLGTQVG